MIFENKLIIFPTTRAVREYVYSLKEENLLLPNLLSIGDFFKKVVALDGRKYCDEEQRFLLLYEAIKNIDIEKLGISKTFSKFLKQKDYIYRFLVELESEKVLIDDIAANDTYEFYKEHLGILKQIHINYLKLMEENNFVDKINFSKNYKINLDYIKRFSKIELHFEGYFTKVEFDLIKEISKIGKLEILFYSNNNNQRSLNVFKNIFKKNKKEIQVNHCYRVDLSNEVFLEDKITKSKVKKIEIKGFSQRVNQIAFIKSSIADCIENNIKPENIAVVLPDESFVKQLQLFDSEKYFNYAMGKDIKNTKLYQIANVINLFIIENEEKYKIMLNYFEIDSLEVENKIKKNWNNICTKDNLSLIIEYLKSFENNTELLEKFDDIIYKINILLFSNDYKIKLKDVYKILLQRLNTITLDDVNSGKITVMGLLETRSIQFDAIIICDFNDEFIPKRSLKDKFLSTNIKKISNLPTLADRENLQKYYYVRLIESSSKVYISYVDNEESKITRFANELFKNKVLDKNYDENYKHILFKNNQLSYFNEDIIESFDLTKFTWSASSLKVFLECKRKFYLKYIAKIMDHDISFVPKPYELGSLIHKILENFFSLVPSLRSKEELNNIILEQSKNLNPLLMLDLEVFKGKIYKLIEFDRTRENKKVIALEKSFGCEYEGIHIIGKMDRVDFKDEYYEILDYKTSSSLKLDTLKNYEKSCDFQMEFYYLGANELYKTDKIKTYYYDLANIKLLEEEIIDEKLLLLKDKFEELKDLSKAPINFLKCDKSNICRMCPYKIICNKE